MSLSPGDVVGAYEVVAPLGSGGMASVYRVRHQVLQSEHALKVLREDLVERRSIRDRFLDEGRLQASFRHPGLVRVTGVVSEPGVAGLIMDFLEGEDLRTRLEREGPQPVGRAATWVVQALDALAHAHAQGVVHRDIKPSNLFLETTPEGPRVRVLDFGVAKVLGKHRTRARAAIGTCAYMSPEQIERPDQVDARTDLFAMGAVLYELVTGAEAFGSQTDFETMQRITAGRYEPIHVVREGLPDALARVVSSALRVEPEQRFASAEDMAAALRSLADPADPGAPAPPRPTPPPLPPTVLDPRSTPDTFVMEPASAPPPPPPRVSRAPSSPPPPPKPRLSTPPPPPRPEVSVRQLPSPPPLHAVQRPVHREDDRTVHMAGVLQLLSGVMDLLVMWFAGCVALGSAAMAIAAGVGIPAWGSWMFGCLGLGSLLLLPLGALEVVSGLQALARGGRGRGLVRATAWAQVASVLVGGLTASLVGVSTLILLAVRAED